MTITQSSTVPLRVNGVEHAITAPALTTLLTVLRDELALTGTKRGCNQGVCGACTVLIDGEPMRACLSVAANCSGQDITTIEGLDEKGKLTAIQQALIDTGAVQCGFCTAGMVLTAHAMLNHSNTTQVDDIRRALSGNLCRCSGYKKLIDAIVSVAQRNTQGATQ